MTDIFQELKNFTYVDWIIFACTSSILFFWGMMIYDNKFSNKVSEASTVNLDGKPVMTLE